MHSLLSCTGMTLPDGGGSRYSAQMVSALHLLTKGPWSISKHKCYSLSVLPSSTLTLERLNSTPFLFSLVLGRSRVYVLVVIVPNRDLMNWKSLQGLWSPLKPLAVYVGTFAEDFHLEISTFNIGKHGHIHRHGAGRSKRRGARV